MHNKDKYLKALVEVSYTNFNEKEWLLNNFNLYKLTLNWNAKLPPIKRSNLIKGTLREKFSSIYEKMLNEYEHKLNKVDQTLIIKDKHFWI